MQDSVNPFPVVRCPLPTTNLIKHTTTSKTNNASKTNIKTPKLKNFINDKAFNAWTLLIKRLESRNEFKRYVR